jgi:hypothetical protein
MSLELASICERFFPVLAELVVARSLLVLLVILGPKRAVSQSERSVTRNQGAHKLDVKNLSHKLDRSNFTIYISFHPERVQHS